MFRDKILETLNRSKTNDQEDEKTIRAIDKIQRQERLSSEEFLKVYDTLWKEGPKVKC
jgi:phage gp16-like protein